MRKITIILFLFITTIASSQEFYHIKGTEKILSSKDSIQPYLNKTKETYNKTSVEKYGYIANSVSYDLGETIQRNDSTIISIEFILDLQKVDYKKEKIFEFKDKKLPDLDLISLKGNKINNKSIKGKVTFINLWFVNCPPCLKEIPQLNKLKKDFGEEVNFIAITFDPKEKVVQFLKRKPFNFEIAVDQKELLEKGFQIESYPKILIVDKEGKISFISNGLKENKLESSSFKHTIDEIKVHLKELIK
ncbi:MAG: TlpA disulfide reductase family protein [Gillisia sp.]